MKTAFALLMLFAHLLFITDISAAHGVRIRGNQVRATAIEAWLADFHQLIEEMSSHYANLEWAVQQRRMNLPALREKTEESLRKATTAEEAELAFKSLLALSAMAT